MKNMLLFIMLLFSISLISDFLVKERISDSNLLKFAAIPVKSLAAETVESAPIDIRELIPEKDARNRYIYQVKKIIIHHDEIFSGDFSNEPVSIISNYHLQKWNSVGYHYYIARSGKTYYLNDVSRITPHCKGQNQRSIGICLHGDFNEEQPTGNQYIALNRLIRKLRKQYGIQAVNLHSNYRNTSCPGKHFNRQRIAKPEKTKLWTLTQKIKAFL